MKRLKPNLEKLLKRVPTTILQYGAVKFMNITRDQNVWFINYTDLHGEDDTDEWVENGVYVSGRSLRECATKILQIGEVITAIQRQEKERQKYEVIENPPQKQKEIQRSKITQ